MGFFDRFRKRATSQPESLADYADRFMAALRASGDTRAWRFEPRFSQLVEASPDDGAVPSTIRLPNLFREFVSTEPEGREACMQRHVEATRPVALPGDFAEARHKLRPVICSTAERGLLALRLHGASVGPELARRPLSNSLEIGLAYDGAFNFTQLAEASLAKWGVGFDAALDAALDNLRQDSTGPWLVMPNGVFKSAYGDHFDPSRLLLVDLLHRLPLDGAPVVMAPNRGVLLLTGERNEPGLQTLVELAEEALDEPRPLPPLMLRWSGTAWEKFVPDALAAALHKLHLRVLTADYRDQQVLLRDLLEREGRDVFVATHTVVELKDGRHRSMCVWSEGVHALLPDTDIVAIDRESTYEKAFVPHYEFRRRFAEIATPTGHVPIRYEVRHFPDPEAFAELMETYGELPTA